MINEMSLTHKNMFTKIRCSNFFFFFKTSLWLSKLLLKLNCIYNHTEFASYITVIYIYKTFKVYIYIYNNFILAKRSSPQVWPYVHCTSTTLCSLTFLLFTFSYSKTSLTFISITLSKAVTTSTFPFSLKFQTY